MFLTKEYDNGNVRPLNFANRSLASAFSSISLYEDKLKFWAENELIHINYVFTDNINEEGAERINISIDPKTREEWEAYYLYKRGIEVERLKSKIRSQLKGFEHLTQKQEFIRAIVAEIETKLVIQNPNKVYNAERDRLYAYECEQKGEIPYRKHFNIQMDEATIFGGVCYQLKHFLLNFDPTSKVEEILVDGTDINTDNDFLESTIEDYLHDLQKEFRSKEDYGYVLKVLYSYFSSGSNGEVKPIFIKKGNKTKLAFALGEIYRAVKTDPITLEYLKFMKSLFLIFKDEDLTKQPLRATNLYKYATTK